MQKTNRRLDRKVKELTNAIEEERRHAEQAKDAVSHGAEFLPDSLHSRRRC